MAEPKILYDEPADTLYIAFCPGERATGLSLSEHILLRVDKRNRRAIGITLLDFSILTDQSEIGPRSFPLSGLDDLTPESRELAMELLHSPPVSDFLTVSAYSPAGTEVIPIAVLNTDKLVARAA
ncbi:MAG TPA: DUF2283 domain-containing protein [Longimicrobium sp.]|nr:DUF2283 domain-containing protein [Longimicrobium sp.]